MSTKVRLTRMHGRDMRIEAIPDGGLMVDIAIPGDNLLCPTYPPSTIFVKDPANVFVTTLKAVELLDQHNSKQ